MRAKGSSLTAEIVALARAIASDARTPEGRVARAVLPLRSRAVARLLELPGARASLPAPSRELIAHVALRCAILDVELERAVARGLTQVVILGAGLDTRAHRLDGLARADVLEVDHPNSQAVKQRAARALPLRARSLRYVAVDFVREALSERLAESGYDARRASAFVLEGVVPYLAREALESTLAQISASAAPGSTLMLTYVPQGDAWYERMRWLSERALRAIGEPLVLTLAPQAMRAMIERAGLRVVSDTAPAEWQHALGRSSGGAVPIGLERLLVADIEIRRSSH